MTLALIPGSFDPVTIGHIDLVQRASSAFDQVVVAVGVNAAKEGWLAPGQRVELIEASLADLDLDSEVRVVSFEGLLADLAKELDATAIIKGVRGVVDLDSEKAQASVNRDIAGVETFLLPSDPRFTNISSSMVRELFSAEASVSAYVPRAVSEFLETIRPKKSKSAPAGFGA